MIPLSINPRQHPRFVLAPLFLLSIVLMLCAPASAQDAAGEEFTIIALPDTQIATQDYPEVFRAQTKWIADNRNALNIRFVLGLGDIVHDADSIREWEDADTAIRTLDGRVPYALAIGNHDYKNETPSSRSAANYNSYFGVSRYSGYPWYRGHYPSNGNENFYATFTANGKTYLVLVLEFHPRNEVITWADSILAANRDKEVLLVTHSFMYSDGTRVDGCDTNDMTASRGNNGETLWEKFVTRHPNLIMVFSGHIVKDGASRRADLGRSGNLVNQMLSNYQNLSLGGGGYLRVLRFKPALNRVEVTTYSPWYKQYKTDSRNQFVINYKKPANSGSEGGISGRVRSVRTSTGCTNIERAEVSHAEGKTLTDDKGYFSLPAPIDDSVSVSAAKSGWKSASKATGVQAGYPSHTDFFLPSDISCTLRTTNPSVTICKPNDGATVTSPVRIAAGTTSSSSVSYMQIYVDHQKVHQVSGGTLDATIPLAEGPRRVTVQARNSSGVIFKQTINITVSNGEGTGPCALSSVNPSVTICTPADGADVASPVRVVAGTTSSTPVQNMQVFVDGSKAFEVNADRLDTSLTLTPGQRQIVVQARDANGALFNKAITVNVGGGSGGSCAPGTADPSVNICTPSDGATLDSPVRIQAATNTSKTVTSMKIYVDGTSVYHVQAASIDTNLALTPGPHRITVKAWHSDETSFSQTINITVNETSAEVCTPGTADPSVKICTPADGATLDSPVRVQAATNSSKTVTAMKIYVDGTSVHHVQASSVETSLALTPGAHRITVKAWQDDGSNFSQTINVTVN